MPSSEILAVAADNYSRFVETLSIGEACLLFGGQVMPRNGDSEFPFRQSSDILYISAWPEEHVAIFIARREASVEFIFFVQAKDEKREIWTGRRYGPEGAKNIFGATEAYTYDQLPETLPKLLKNIHTLHYRFAESAQNDRLVMKAISMSRRTFRYSAGIAPSTFIDLHSSLHRQRLQKSQMELDLLRRAAYITTEAHKNAMKRTRPGVFEYELEADLSHTFRRMGGSGPGYTSIVGGGDNAVVLHYVNNNDELKDGDLVCVDAGCEYFGYTADVTRTWPVNGRFTESQKELYSAVLEALKIAISAAVVGNAYKDIHNAAVRSLTGSLIELGFLDGDIEQCIEQKAYSKWYMHGTSHWLGIDVHDVGSYSDMEGSQKLLPGMVMTVEPGLYIAADDESAPSRFRGMGIRIEDDILILPDGNENLTQQVPREIAEIESLMGQG